MSQTFSLPKGDSFLVDDADAEQVSKHRWTLIQKPSGRLVYSAPSHTYLHVLLIGGQVTSHHTLTFANGNRRDYTRRNISWNTERCTRCRRRHAETGFLLCYTCSGISHAEREATAPWGPQSCRSLGIMANGAGQQCV